MENINLFDIPRDFTEQDVVEALASLFSIDTEQTTTERYIFFDTFDWRLFAATLLLYQSGPELVLRHLHGENILGRQVVQSAPKFAWDLPAGAVKDYLDPVIEMRALLAQTEVSMTHTTHRILNKDDKTVVRFVCKSLTPAEATEAPPPARWVQIKPVRGYGKPLKKLRRQLEKLGLTPTSDNFALKALAAGERTPDDYLAKLKVSLSPHMRADEATKVILRSAVQMMRLNEAGIKQDIDTEFLHDFRVAVRRTRSVLSQMKDVFPVEPTRRFRREFAAIGKISNELRDLDVYLLAEDNFKAMLPAAVCGDITPLFDYMRQMRTAAHQKVIDGLNSADYAATMQAWETFLAEPDADSPGAGHGAVPVKILAQQKIYRKYRQIIKWGNRILKNMEDEQLHDLRLECKKLRYLMDFFQSLFPAKKLDRLIKQVKKLQNNLGDFNDLCVQEEYLLNTSHQLPISGPEVQKVFVAVGCLVGTIQRERVRVKAQFAQTFADFAAPKNQKLFKKLFDVKKAGAS